MVLAALRQHLPDAPSWSAIKKILRARRVTIGGVLCIDEGRQLSRGEVVTVLDQPMPPPPTDKDVSIVYVDAALVVAEKPSGMVSLRRQADQNWSWNRKNQQPTLDECVARLIANHGNTSHGKSGHQNKSKPTNYNHLPQLFPVHRIDRDTSGLLVFARNSDVQTDLIQQFAQHQSVRMYLALIPGSIEDQTVRSHFVRDRGDGLRGSSTNSSDGQLAITHFRTLKSLGRVKPPGNLSELECRLETGRTNQIRIHLAELGHPICGDIKYRGPFGTEPIEDQSCIRRLALHAAQLNFEHPVNQKPMSFQSPWPADIQRYLKWLDSKLQK